MPTTIPVDKSKAENIKTVEGNGLAIFVNDPDGIIKMKDTRGNVQPFSDYIQSAVGGITSLNGLTAAIQTFAVGSSGTDFNISSSTSTTTFNIPSASTTARGLMTIVDQSFAGDKTFIARVNADTLGVGLTTALNGQAHIKGASNSSGNALYVQNLANTFSFAVANIAASVADGYVRITSGSNQSDSTMLFVVNTVLDGSPRFNFFANGYLQFSGCGSIGTVLPGINNTLALRNGLSSGGIALGYASDGTYGGDSTESIVSLGLGSTYAGTGVTSMYGMYVLGTYNQTSGSAVSAAIKISSTLQSITGSYAGFDFEPTITSVAALYGIRIRSAVAASGFGLGSTVPTASVDIVGSTTSLGSLRINSGVAPTGGALLDGMLWYTGSALFNRVGSVTKSLAYNPITQTVNATTATTSINLATASVVLLNLQTGTTALTLTNLAVGTYILKVKQDATGSRLLTYTTTISWSGGAAPTLTTTANFSDVITLIYDGTNILGTVTPNFNV